MNDRPPGANTAGIVAGIFLIIAGLCLVLLGGGCSVVLVMLIGESSSGGDSSVIPLLLLSVLVLGGGIALIWLGARLMSGRANKS